ncbi:MAG: NAD-binding protein [Desulfobacterales bacterium]
MKISHDKVKFIQPGGRHNAPRSCHREANSWLRWRQRLVRLWPQWPLAAALVLIGLLNILHALRYDLGDLSHFATFSGVGRSLELLGTTAQAILGAGLVLVGIGLLWRLRMAWAFAVLIVALSVGINLVRGQRGASIVIPCLLLLALLVLRHFFNRRPLLASYVISLMSILAVLAYGTFGTYLLGNGFQPRIQDLNSAFYYTIITLSTVGYGDIVPQTREARMFAVFLLVAGLGIFATAIASAIGPAVSGELARIFNPKEKPMKLKNHVILVGAGTIARSAARELAARGVSFVQMVEPGEEPTLADYPVVTGDPGDDKALREAGIATSQMIVAACDDDGDNAFIALAAKEMNPDVRVLAIANSSRSMRRLRLARADLVFAPMMVGSRLLADLVEGVEIPSAFRDLLGGKWENHG